MSRPAKVTEQTFFDIFAGWTTLDQANALKVMEAIHGVAVRQQQRVAEEDSRERIAIARRDLMATGNKAEE